MSLRVRRIENAREFVALAPLWAELAGGSGQTSPFLSYDWFWCCWHAVWPRRHPEILLVEEAAGPVAIIPMMRWKEHFHGLPVRYLGFLECPDTPMVDMLSVGEPGPVIDAFLDHLRSRSDWDVVQLQKLPATSPTLTTLEGALSGRLPWRRAGSLFSPYLTITGGWGTFYGAKSQRFKKTWRNIQNRLERAGPVSVEEHRAVEPGSPLFREAIEVTGRSWKAGQGVAIATMPRMPEFFKELTRRASNHGWLSLWLLRLNGRVIAMEYQLRADGTVHALRADYDATYQELSPGTALNFAIVRSLFERGGVQGYDMGPGLNEYKCRWATGSHETVHLKLYRRHLYSRFLYKMEAAVIPAARRWRERARARRSAGGGLG